MKNNLLLIIILSICVNSLKGQVNIDTPNLSFDDGSLNGWSLYLGDYYYDTASSGYKYDWQSVTQAQSGNRIKIINGIGTSDPIVACGGVLLTNPNNKLVARIGEPLKTEGFINFPNSKKAAAERLVYSFKVTPNTTLFSYKLAAVLKVPAGDNSHTGDQLPTYTMDIAVTDANGVSYSLPCCSYSSKADGGNTNLTQNIACPSSIATTEANKYVYQKWISGNVDLSKQIGKDVRITIITHDCLLNSGLNLNVAGNHEAYGYFWAQTSKIELATFSCENADATIYAPQGFSTYNWTRSDAKPITIPDPTRPYIAVIDKSLNLEGIVYSCEMNDVTSGCGAITVSSTINTAKLHPDFTNIAIDAGKIQFTDTSTAEGDSISDYYWDFGDGSYSALKNPIHTYTDFIPFNVKLTVTSKKGCTKTNSHNVLPTKELIATISPPSNLVYNGQTKDFAVTTNIPGLQLNIDYYVHYSNKPGTPAYNSYTAPAVAGNYNAIFELSYLSLLKYYMTSVPTQDFSIAKAPLKVTVDDVTKTYGTKITLLREAFRQDQSTLYAGDKIYELELICNGLADTASVGTYSITPTKAIGLGVDNYDIDFVHGTLTVYKKALVVNVIDNSKIYGATVTSSGKEYYIVQGTFVGKDTVTSVSLQSSGFNQLANVGTYPIIASNPIGNRLSNYQISYVDASITVKKKTVTVTAKTLNKIYGSTYSFNGKEFITDLTQFVGTDSISQIQFVSQATQQKTDVGEYNISINGFSGNGLDNYDIKLVNSKFTVLPMDITVIPNNKIKEYGDLLTFNGHEFTTDKPMVSGDTISFVLLKSTGYIETAPIGNYDILASMAYGAGTLNYNITYALGSLNVGKKKINATIYPPASLGYNAQTKDFGSNVSVSSLLLNVDYYIRYTNRTGTATYNSLIAPSAAGDYTATFELSAASLQKYYITTIVSSDFTILKAPIAITADNVSKTYGDQLTLIKTAFKSDLKPLFGNDKIYEVDMTCNGLTDTASVGAYSILPVSVTGVGMDNYLIAYSAGILTILPKPLLVKANNISKTYGDMYAPSGNEFYVDPRSLVSNDKVTTVQISSEGFKSTTTIGSYTISISNAAGFRLNNYLINYADANVLISKKKITVSAKTLSKTYGSDYVFSGREFNAELSQFIAPDTITSMSFVSPATPKKATVGDYGISITNVYGNGLDNYDIKLLNSVFKISPMPVTIYANNGTKEYGTLLTFAGNEFNTNKPLITGDSISFVMFQSSGSAKNAPIGDYDIFVSQAYGAGTMNYDFSYQSGKMTIVRSKLAASIFPPSYLGYNGQNKEFTAVLTIPELTQNIHYYIRYTSRVGTPTYNSFVAPATVGDYTASFELSTQSALKYTMDSAPSMNFTITKASLVVTADNATKIYGSKLNILKDAFKTDVNPLYGSDKIFEVEMLCNGIMDTASIGLYSIIPTKTIGNGLDNYNIQFVSGALTISPKELLVKVLDDTKVYGDKNSTNVGAYYVDKQNLVGTDNISSITTASAGYDQLATVGTYTIKASSIVGVRLNNYKIVFSDATLMVTKKKVSVMAKPLTKVYGSEYVFRDDEFTTDINQLVGTDKINAVKLNSQASQKKASVGEYVLSVTDLSGFGMDNYDIKMVSNVFQVTPLPITITAKNLEKEYSDVLTFTGNEFTTNIPLVNGDTISYVFMHSIGSAESSSIGEYDIVPSQLFGAGSLNYQISYGYGKLKVVQKQLKVTALNCVKEYGENDPVLLFSVVDKRGVEYLPSILTGKLTRQPNEKVGVYSITQGTLSVMPSYSFTFTQGQLTIKKALPVIDSYFTNVGGQFIVSTINGTKYGDAPQGSLKLKISKANIDKNTSVVNGRSICSVSNLPTQMFVAELAYQGDDNYLPIAKNLNVFSITYETNGGNLNAPIMNFDGSESVNLEVPSHNLNYKFNGWYETPDFYGDPLKRIPIGTTHDVHLYAQWAVVYEDLSIVTLFNQVLAVANPMNRDFIYASTFKWFKDGVQLDSRKQYCGFDNYIPNGLYRVEIYYQNNAAIVLELEHSAIIPMAKVYPNPLAVNHDLTVVTDAIKENDVAVEVFNSIGIKQANVSVQRNNDSFKLKGFVNKGIYIVKVYKNGEVKETHKVIVED